MRRCPRLFQLSAAAAFRQHVHQHPCRLCEAAERSLAKRVTTPATASNVMAPLRTRSGAFDRPRRTSSSSRLSAPAPVHSSSSLVELRRESLREWMELFSSFDPTQPLSSDEGNNPLSVLNQLSTEELEALYKVYLEAGDADLEATLFAKFRDTLERQGNWTKPTVDEAIATAVTSVSGTSSTAPRTANVRVPQYLFVPHHCSNNAPLFPVSKLTVVRHSGSASSASTSPSAEGWNSFESHVRKRFPNDEAAVAKQLAFQAALLDMKAVLEAVQIPFFLACGTALGARRDGGFIPHDDDIDLGVFYADLAKAPTEQRVASSSLSSSTESVDSLPSVISSLRRVQGHLFALVDSLTATERFCVFDVCGAVEKGLELRVMHTPTSTRVDLNLYYPPVPGGDDALTQSRGSFLWASSFYEEAEKRQHQMYRYLHEPFDTALEELSFCVKDLAAKPFLMPPERYLVENYGEDWRTPKQYSYKEGLKKEFKNILAE